MELTIVLAFGVLALAAVAVVMTRRARQLEAERDAAVSAYKEVCETAKTSYATGKEHGLDEGYKRSEQQHASDRRKKLAQEQGRRIHLN